MRLFPALAALIGAVIAVAGLFAQPPGAAWGHDWYPMECCGGGDCRRVKGEPVAGGYQFTDTNGKVWIVSDDAVRPSKDGFYHLCQPSYAEKPLCYFVPRAGM